ncbi:MAG: hypothetical protein KC613_23150 [Myxococcales bacterium]|nr:hypothetical protein [Myxococcales bacterium]
MSHPRTLTAALLCLAAGCVDLERADVPVPDFVPDAAPPVLPDAAAACLASRRDAAVDLGGPDGAPVDQGVRDEGPPELDGATADQAPPDGTVRDHAPPDQDPPDQAPPDAVPDQAPADQAPPDAAPVCEPERCNRQDDDCDGQVDEGLGLDQPCTVQVGERCEVRGVTDCGPLGDVTCQVPLDDPLRAREARVRNCACDVAANEEGVDRHVICRREVPWADAAALCAVLGTQLWVIDDEAEWASVTTALQLQGGGLAAFWIGLSDAAVEGEFRWVDGRPAAAGYTPWRDGEPNDWQGLEDCAEVGRAGGWQLNDSTCVLGQPFVCEDLDGL